MPCSAASWTSSPARSATRSAAGRSKPPRCDGPRGSRRGHGGARAGGMPFAGRGRRVAARARARRAPHELCTPATGSSTAAELDGTAALVERRAAREPLAYILGEWGFRRLTLRRRSARPDPAAGDRERRRALPGASSPASRRRPSSTSAPAPARSRSRSRTSGPTRGSSRPTSRRPRSRSRRRTGAARPGRARRGSRTVTSSRARRGRSTSSSRTRRTSRPASSSARARAARLGAARGAGRRGRATRRSLARRWRCSPGRRARARGGRRQAAAVAELLGALGFPEVAVSADLAGRERVVEGARP